jgi:hypothetical protein
MNTARCGAVQTGTQACVPIVMDVPSTHNPLSWPHERGWSSPPPLSNCSETYISVRMLGREFLSRMSNNQQVLNVTTGEKMKLKQAKKLVLEGRLLWEVENESVRSVTFADLPSLKDTRERHAQLHSPLPPANCKSTNWKVLTWEPPPQERSETFRANRYTLITQAREFVGAAQ